MLMKELESGSNTADWSACDKGIDPFINGDKESSTINQDEIVSPAIELLPRFITEESSVGLPTFAAVVPVTEVKRNPSSNNFKISTLSMERGMNGQYVLTFMYTDIH
jgi:hypothetical protein